MKIHLPAGRNAAYSAIRDALAAAKDAGQIHPNVGFDKLTDAGSRSHQSAFDVHLYATDRRGGHRWANTGMSGADTGTYAATYDEWGWFFAHLFAAHPTAKAGSGPRAYDGEARFHELTGDAYQLTVKAKASA